MASLSVKEESERCSCCTKDEFWTVYDVFHSMDRQQQGTVPVLILCGH